MIIGNWTSKLEKSDTQIRKIGNPNPVRTSASLRIGHLNSDLQHKKSFQLVSLPVPICLWAAEGAVYIRELASDWLALISRHPGHYI
ncbi:hypothetical protein EB796_012514 [Bugula neritina]|uniref:Uncharacterized protein n=1 Tax=Bugula neritina TaxID=10212 RepID=A0A7J7JV39_BUGNE|nr:hypothetical protein EB796_012514 [Bugula neritina]